MSTPPLQVWETWKRSRGLNVQTTFLRSQNLFAFPGLGGAVGYALGGLDWMHTFLGAVFKSQEQILFIFAAILFSISVVLHLFSIEEQQYSPQSDRLDQVQTDLCCGFICVFKTHCLWCTTERDPLTVFTPGESKFHPPATISQWQDWTSCPKAGNDRRRWYHRNLRPLRSLWRQSFRAWRHGRGLPGGGTCEK